VTKRVAKWAHERHPKLCPQRGSSSRWSCSFHNHEQSCSSLGAEVTRDIGISDWLSRSMREYPKHRALRMNARRYLLRWFSSFLLELACLRVPWVVRLISGGLGSIEATWSTQFSRRQNSLLKIFVVIGYVKGRINQIRTDWASCSTRTMGLWSSLRALRLSIVAEQTIVLFWLMTIWWNLLHRAP